MNDIANDSRGLLAGAFRALEDMRARLEIAERSQREPIAVIGLGCRFPKADNPEAFWSLLREGRDAVDDAPPGRWNVEAFYDPDPNVPGKMYTKRGAFLDRVDTFDPAFFGIAPREAVTMDPQQRLFLEVAWEALEDAGLPPDRLGGSSTGVFLGICNNDYAHTLARAGVEAIDAYTGTGTTPSVAAGRLSYILGLQGPCMTVDTACSSSLVALDLAVQHLRSGRCDQALVGGVNLLLMPESTVYFCKVRALAPDGRCKTFDASADGYGRGEGCGVVVLKRLSDALRDGDDIRAVVRGVAVNHDGRSNGLTAPNGLSQESVINAALADAGAAPHEIGYVEAHGTGTPLGDPIELAALARAYGDRDGPLIVGSAKTNISHLEAAAGVAGLIKTILALQHGEIPAHLHFQRPNAHLPWDSLPISVPSQAVAWPVSAPMAGVSSFGFSGTNAHVILEAGPPRSEPTTPRPASLLTVSAPTEAAARALAGRYAASLSQADLAVAADTAFSANTGRAHFKYRAAVVGSPGELATALRDLAGGETPFHRLDGSDTRVVFLFTGQGSQFAGMARALDADEPIFRDVIDRCDAIFQDEFGTDLRALLWGDGEDGRLDETAFTQPALYAIECALTALWRSWGVVPAAVIGHSVGEFAAMQAAGVLSLEDGFRLVATRGRMMQTLCERGAMAAVTASETRIRDLLGDLPADLSIAAVNASEDVVLSGVSAALDAALDHLAGQGVRHRRLTVSHAFHSPLMEPMLDGFAAYAAAIPLAPPAIPLISNLTGSRLEDAPDASYWRRHAREAVRFGAGLATLKADGHTIFLEVGPQPVLLGMARRSGLFDDTPNALWLPSLRKTGDDVREMLEAVAALYRAGAPIDWPAFEAGRGRRTALPTYPFERQRFWLDDVAASPDLAPTAHAPGLSESPAAPWSAAPTVSTQDVSAFASELHAANPGDRYDLLLDRIQSEVKRVLRLPAKPDLKQGLFELGMDSLMAVELRSRLEAGLGQALPSTIAFDHPTIERLARHLLDLIAPSGAAPAAGLKKADPQAPIAIVGLGCRFPGGANDPDSFWRLLRDGQDAVTQIPARRWSAADWFDPDPERVDKSYCQSGGFLDVAVEDFDSQFFGITPREATTMDPQQRLLLEVAWEALEDAGRPPVEGDRTGVFVGVNANDYARLLGQGGKAIDAYAFTGNTFSVAAGRLSHTLGFQGPSVAIDTACSSSLVAVHLACQSLRMGECEAALAGGVNLMLAPDAYVALSRMHALAPDGRCKTFDASADGYGRGEGCGLVVLKRLSDALADGDDVLAVIQGSAVNQDGASGGLTVPNGVAQQALIDEALERAGLSPGDIGYLEAHGTGTPLGDPIELAAAARALRPGEAAERPLLVGSVKTNIGHLEAAAGVAGLIKTVLALRHETIPRHLHFETPNPQVEWSALPIEVTTEAVAWPSGEVARFAGVSSFGMSGTNAHVIVGEGPSRVRVETTAEPDPVPQVIPLSGRSEAAARALAERYQPLADAPLADLAFAAGSGRSHFEHRIAILADNGQQLAQRLEAAAQGRSVPGVLRGQVSGAQRPRIAFVFTGQGSQYAGMGKALYGREPVFKAALDRCDALLDGALLPVLFEDDTGLVDQTGWTQPALFSLEYALCALWRSWGVEPSVVLGHSVGEYVAACVAGVFSLEEGLSLVARRAQLMQALPPGGAMAAVWAAEADLDLSGYGERLSLAAVNGPGDLVVSGEAEALDALRAELQAKGVASRPLTVSHAFHSPLMTPVLEPFGQMARTVDYQRPQIRLIRDLDGALADGPLDADYWTAHLRRPVRFHDALQTLKAQDCAVVVEIGPHPTLTAMARPEAGGPPWLASLRRKRGDLATLRETLAGLYVAGAPIDWAAVHRHQPHNPVRLPTYPFQRKPYWMAPTPAVKAGGGVELFHETQWRAASLTAQPQASTGSVLIFADRSGVAERLAEALTATGQTCTLVRRVGDMGRADHRIGSLDALDQTLPGILAASAPSAVAYLWNLDLAGMRDEADSCGELTALHLIQGVLREAAAAPPKLWFVSRGGQPVGDAPVAPHQAPLWGVGRALSLEHPEVWGGLVDLSPEAHPDEASDLARQLLGGDGEDLVAFRDGRRLVARLASAEVPKPAPPPVRPDASYLVTGGLGSLGRAVARWLADAGARSLVLAGRSRPSEAAAADIAALEATGVRVTVLPVDVGDRASLAPALAEIAADLPPLRGIVHAAGVLDDGALYAQTDDRFIKVMRPKARGAWNLHDLTRELPLDFFVMFSSAATLFGSPGQANYAAANAFLDGLAHHRRSLGLPALSVGWGPWRDIGMAADLARRTGKTHAPRGVSALAPAEALRRLGDLMNAASPQVAVMPVDWPAFLEQFAPGGRPRALDDLAGLLPETAPREELADRGPSAILSALIAAPARERRAILIQFLQAELAAITGDDDLADPDAGFFDMGLDSLMAVEMKNRLGANLSLTLPATVVFRFPNITALTDHLLVDVLGLHEPPQADAADARDEFEGASEAELLALLAGELEGAAP